MVTGSGPVDRVRDVVAPVVDAAALSLEDVHVSPAGRRTVVRVVVDLDADAVGSLDSDSLAAVSRGISAALDAADPVKGAYVLEVSTPGTDRPLTEPRHYRRARTRLVRLTLRDGSVVAGRLTDADDATLVLDVDGTPATVALADLVSGVVEVELSRVADVDEQIDADDADEEEDA